MKQERSKPPIRFVGYGGLLLVLLTGSVDAASTIFAGTEGGPLQSTDGGSSWQYIAVKTNSPLLSGQPRFNAVAIDPKSPSTWYATGGLSAFGFYKSTDMGQTWSGAPLIGFQPISGPGTIAIDPVMTNVIYMVANSGSGGDGFIVKSTDSGTTWSMLKLPNTTYFSAGSFPTGASAGSIATDLRTAGVLFAVANQYLFKSIDFGVTWTTLSTGIDTAEAANNRGGVDIGFPILTRVDVDPRDGRLLYASARGESVDSRCTHRTGGGQCGLYKSTDGGLTWTALSLPAPSAHSLSIDPITGTLYVGANVSGLGGAILKSADGGNSWIPLKNGFGGVFGPFVRIDPSTPSAVYAINGFDTDNIYFYRSTDSGATWAEINLPRLCPIDAVSCKSPPVVSAFHDLVVVPAAGAGASGAPAVSQNGVVNGAGFQTGIVPNSWATIFGSNLAATSNDWSKSIVNGRFPTTLDGVKVTIGGKPAYIYYITPTQLNILVPDMGFGQMPLTVTTSAGTSATLTVTTAQYGPAFFTWPNNQPVATRRDFSLAAKSGTFAGLATIPAKPGDVLILWGTGFGPTRPVAPEGAAVPGDTTYSTAILPTVTLNGVPVTVYGAALAPGFAGLYQIAIQVPDSIADGDWAIQAGIGGVQSPSGIAVSIHR